MVADVDGRTSPAMLMLMLYQIGDIGGRVIHLRAGQWKT